MNIRARISQSIVVIGLFLLSIGLLTGTAQAKKPLTPGCFDNSTNQYVDCGNGTMTDNVTGLIWMSNPDCLVQAQTWADAKLVAASLKDKECGLRDNSKPGDWRLMTADEWTRASDRASHESRARRRRRRPGLRADHRCDRRGSE